jgi:hypothetical protein
MNWKNLSIRFLFFISLQLATQVAPVISEKHRSPFGIWCTSKPAAMLIGPMQTASSEHAGRAAVPFGMPGKTG